MTPREFCTENVVIWGSRLKDMASGTLRQLRFFFFRVSDGSLLASRLCIPSNMVTGKVCTLNIKLQCKSTSLQRVHLACGLLGLWVVAWERFVVAERQPCISGNPQKKNLPDPQKHYPQQIYNVSFLCQ